jgi:hypothetical protein
MVFSPDELFKAIDKRNTTKQIKYKDIDMSKIKGVCERTPEVNAQMQLIKATILGIKGKFTIDDIIKNTYWIINNGQRNNLIRKTLGELDDFLILKSMIDSKKHYELKKRG